MLHDQYRDYYTDAPSWDPQFAVHEEDTTTASTTFPGSRFEHWKDGYIPMMDTLERRRPELHHSVAGSGEHGQQLRADFSARHFIPKARASTFSVTFRRTAISIPNIRPRAPME